MQKERGVFDARRIRKQLTGRPVARLLHRNEHSCVTTHTRLVQSRHTHIHTHLGKQAHWPCSFTTTQRYNFWVCEETCSKKKKQAPQLHTYLVIYKIPSIIKAWSYQTMMSFLFTSMKQLPQVMTVSRTVYSKQGLNGAQTQTHRGWYSDSCASEMWMIRHRQNIQHAKNSHDLHKTGQWVTVVN